MSANTLMYGYNPYAFNPYSTGLNNDFMFNATGGYNQLAQQQALIQGYQQPQTDTFQKSGSGIGGLGLGLLAGGGATAGMYYFGTNPIKDGKVADGLINSMNSVKIAEEQTKIYNRLYEAELTKKLPTGMTLEQYRAVEQLSKTNGIGDLADSVKSKLPADVQSPEAARNKLTTIKVDEIDTAKLHEKAGKLVKYQDFNVQNQRLKGLQSVKSKIAALGDNATKAEIENLIKANPEQYGLSGKTEAEVNRLARNIANKLDTKASLTASLDRRITSQTTRVNNLRNGLETAVRGHLDESGKVLATAPEGLSKAVKNFKWKTAGKWGAIAAGAGLLLGYLFGGNK